MKKIAMLAAGGAAPVRAGRGGDRRRRPAYALTLPEGFAPVIGGGAGGLPRGLRARRGRRLRGRGAAGAARGRGHQRRGGGDRPTPARARPPGRWWPEYAGYVAGFESVEPQYVEAGGREFALVQVSLDGEVASQYLLVEGGALYTLTFVGVPEEEALATLAGMTFAAEATPSPTAAPLPSAPAASAAPLSDARGLTRDAPGGQAAPRPHCLRFVSGILPRIMV